MFGSEHLAAKEHGSEVSTQERGGISWPIASASMSAPEARAGVFDAAGSLLGSAMKLIATQRPADDFVEQSSRDIWEAVCDCVRRACADAAIDTAAVTGIGFDATCSLVVVDAAGAPVTVSPTGLDDWNIFV